MKTLKTLLVNAVKTETKVLLGVTAFYTACILFFGLLIFVGASHNLKANTNKPIVKTIPVKATDNLTAIPVNVSELKNKDIVTVHFIKAK
jgi:hypothetical protein